MFDTHTLCDDWSWTWDTIRVPVRNTRGQIGETNHISKGKPAHWSMANLETATRGCSLENGCVWGNTTCLPCSWSWCPNHSKPTYSQQRRIWTLSSNPLMPELDSVLSRAHDHGVTLPCLHLQEICDKTSEHDMLKNAWVAWSVFSLAWLPRAPRGRPNIARCCFLAGTLLSQNVRRPCEASQPTGI